MLHFAGILLSEEAWNFNSLIMTIRIIMAGAFTLLFFHILAEWWFIVKLKTPRWLQIIGIFDDYDV